MKYINPDNPKETWVAKGRGRPPKWVTEMKKRMLDEATNKKIGKQGAKKIGKKEVQISKRHSASEKNTDALAPHGTVLNDGTFMLNGKMTYVGPDFYLFLTEGDRFSKVC